MACVVKGANVRFYKTISGGYILAIGTGIGGDEITEAEYNEIVSIILNKPTHTDTTDYRLREDLTWEPYEIEPVPDPEPTIEDKAEAYDILVGGAE